MAGRRICYLLALAGSLLFYGAFQEWVSYIILLVILLAPWFSLIFSLWALIRVRFKLIMPERIPVGAKAAAKLEAVNTAVAPPFTYRLRATKPNTGESFILPRDGALPTEHCGGLEVKAERLKIYDHLGLFSFKVRKPPIRTVPVMPEDKKLPVPEALTRLSAYSWKPKRGGGYAENHEIRQYRQGDPINLIHWKLSAKAEELMIREPMEPDKGIIFITADINGTAEELDRKYSRLLCYGNYLIERGVTFEMLALTGNGVETKVINGDAEWRDCMDLLLCAPFAAQGSVRELNSNTGMQYYVGGEPDEE